MRTKFMKSLKKNRKYLEPKSLEKKSGNFLDQTSFKE